jgi:hypothetical protein
MKMFIMLLVFSTSAFAQSSFLSKKETKEINDYLDDICADTYCGGDLNFRPYGITCRKNFCSVEFGATGAGNGLFNTTRANDSLGSIMTALDDGDVKVTMNDVLFETIDDEDLGIALYGSFNFTCKLTNLANRLKEAASKRDLFYDMVVFGCIRQVERTVYNRQI